jgi:hypothetical protein
MPEPVDFHTHHGAFGAYGSFTLGHVGAGGGFSVHDGRAPASGEVHIGVLRKGRASFFPFSKPSGADLSAYATSSGNVGSRVETLDPATLERVLGWGTDTWRSGAARFSLATPFGPVPDPRGAGWEALADHILPAVWAELELDNTQSDEPAVLVAGVAPGDTGAGLLDRPGLVGVGLQGRFGIASSVAFGASAYAGFSLFDGFGADLSTKVPHWLGTCWGLSWPVAPRERRVVRFSLGWYHEGPATTGLPTVYAYTRLWKSLDAVLERAVEGADRAWETARARDRELDGLSAERRWILAHATRGYFGNSQLLVTARDEPVYVVNEGEYAMMNTLDLSVDQGFFEGRFFPWAVREILDLAASRHSFLDRLKVPGDTILHEGGVSFCHDMGVRNRFSEPGTSSYELPDRDGCFSQMTFEQISNWILLAAGYSRDSGDVDWVRSKRDLLQALLTSLERREHPDPEKRRGTPGADSSRCGTGIEITTYDSLDPSLSQSRGNIYATVKLWATYLALERLLGEGDLARAAEQGARRCAAAVERWPESKGMLHALADGRAAAVVLPAVEGLVHPLSWGDADAVSPAGRFGAMVRVLGTHLARALDSGACRFPDGGWRLSSSSDNSWISKIALAQHVAESVFKRPPDRRADAAHVAWLSPGSAAWGFTDQIVSGRGIGSKFYPRGVTAVLHLD